MADLGAHCPLTKGEKNINVMMRIISKSVEKKWPTIGTSR
jgi:hypothetical protein